MARSPIPQLIEDFHQMSPEEQRCFLDLVDPQPEPVPAKPQKKSETRTIQRCVACNYTRRAIHHNEPTHREYHVFDPPLSQSSKKGAGKGGRGKSVHASSLQEQIQKRKVGPLKPSSSESPSIGSDDDDDQDGNEYERCQAERGEGRTCYLLPDHNVHHLQNTVGYHPFVSFASRAEGLSVAVSSDTQREDVSNVHHAGG